MGKVGHQSSNFFLRRRLHRILYFLHAIGCVESGSGIAYNESGRHHFWAQMSFGCQCFTSSPESVIL